MMIELSIQNQTAFIILYHIAVYDAYSSFAFMCHLAERNIELFHNQVVFSKRSFFVSIGIYIPCHRLSISLVTCYPQKHIIYIRLHKIKLKI